MTQHQPDPTETLILRGVYFDGQSSRDREAELQIRGEQASLKIMSGEPLPQRQESWPQRVLVIEPPLTRVRRVIRLPGGGRFETQDDAGVSLLESRTHRNWGLGRVRRIEASWGLTLGAVITLGLFVWGFLSFGLPALARSAAAATPRSVLASFDQAAIKTLDNGSFMGPTHLGKARQAQLQAEFATIGKWAGGNYPYRLLLRNGKPATSDGAGFAIGANAFALPNGTVVMTDQLVALSRNDRELMGVLAHETGHVTHRHALASVYQGLGLTLLGTAITGDLVSAGTFAAAVPTALLTNGYSRQAETQADESAAAYMLGQYHTTKPLRDLLARLELDDKNASEGDVKADVRVKDMLQTHPGTRQRLDHLRALEQAARK